VSLLGAALLEVFIAFGGVPLWYWVSTLKRPTTSTEANWLLWWIVGGIAVLPVLALIIANRKKIGTPSAPSAKAWWWIGGIIAAVAATYGLTKVPYGKISGDVGDFFSFIPFWVYGVVLLVFCIVVMAVKEGKTPGERTKKGFELFYAFVKLAVLIAFLVALVVFIIGPRAFWGSYEMSPEVAAMAPSRQATQTGGASVATRSAPYPREVTIAVPMGTIQTPLTNWSDVLVLNGRASDLHARGPHGQDGVLAVHADGIIHIIGPNPTTTPNIGRPREMRFLSLTNFPLTLKGTVE